MKKILPFLLTVILLSSCGLFSKEYTPGHKFGSQEDLIQTLEKGEWNFELQNVTGPMVPSNFNAYGFGFEVRGNSIRCYLPYFGVSYKAPRYGSNEGPLTFEAPISSYTVKKGSHSGEAEIEIVTHKDKQNAITLHVNAFTNGSASVTMISTDTQSLGYRGIISLPADTPKN